MSFLFPKAPDAPPPPPAPPTLASTQLNASAQAQAAAAAAGAGYNNTLKTGSQGASIPSSTGGGKSLFGQ